MKKILFIIFLLLFVGTALFFIIHPCPKAYTANNYVDPRDIPLEEKVISWYVRKYCPNATPVSSIAVAATKSADLTNLKSISSTLTRAYDKIDIFDAWNFINNRPVPLFFSTTTIGIIDTGVDFKHPEFENVKLGISGPPVFQALQDNAVEFRADLIAGHGTQIAGIIGANNLEIISATSSQMSGIISGVTDKYFLEPRTQKLITFISFGTIIDTLKPGSLVNMSFKRTDCRRLLGLLCIKGEDFNNATNYFKEGIISHPSTTFIIAAGNDAIDVQNSVPSNINASNTIIVAATELNDDRADFPFPGRSSNFGTGIDISAPGKEVYAPAIRGKGNFPTSVEGVVATCPLTNTSSPSAFGKGLCNYQKDFQGTSASAPLVTGVAAILKSIKPLLTPAEIKDILTRTADPFFAPIGSNEAKKLLGSGCSGTPQTSQVIRGCRLNALRAVQSLFAVPKPPKPYSLNPHTLFYTPLDDFYTVNGFKFIRELADTPNIPDTLHDCRVNFQTRPDLYSFITGQFNNALKVTGLGISTFHEGQILCNNRPIRLVGTPSSTDYTVGFWMKSETKPREAGYIFFLVNTFGDVRPIWILIDSLSRFAAITHPPFDPQGNALFSDNPKILDANFHHYLTVFNHNQKKISLFIDGIMDKEIPIITTIIPTGKNTLELLVSNTVGFDPNLTLDDFFAENRSWTQDDLTRFLTTGNPPSAYVPLKVPNPNTLPEMKMPVFGSSTILETSTLP